MGSWELCIEVQNNIFRFAVCKYNKKNKKIMVSNYFQVDIPQEFDVFNKNDIDAIVGLIRTALKTNGIKIKRYHLCLSHKSIITRIIKLPKMENRDLQSFMQNSIHQYFPIVSSDYYFDYRIQSVNENDEKTYYNLFLVAMPKILLETYTNLFLKCGLRPKIVNIYSDVIANLFVNFINEYLIVIELGYSQTEIIILEGSNIFINSVSDFAIQKPGELINEDTYLKNLTPDDLGEDFFEVIEKLEDYINFFLSRHYGEIIQDIFFIGKGEKLIKVINFLKVDMTINISSGKELFKSKIVTYKMSQEKIDKFDIEGYYSCFGLLLGGMSK